MTDSIHISRDDQWRYLLSDRQCKVAFLVARGLSNEEVAHELGLKIGTVKVRLHNIFVRLGAKSRYDLINHGSNKARPLQRSK